MKKLLLLLAMTSVMATTLLSQAFNTTLRDQLSYPQALNDVWGYVAPDDTEYALVGTYNGLSVVSLVAPDDITEVAFITGDNSSWRDIKTYGTYAYVVAERGNDGIVIHNLSGLPGTVTAQSYTPSIPGMGTLIKAHNIYIDESTGLAYIAGSNLNNGGMLIFDVATSPGQAIFIAAAPAIYSHDVYVQDGLMYASEIYAGKLTIYDVSNPNAITQVGSTSTPNNFTHNAWTNASGSHVFTTDERGNAYTAVYDITNPALLEEADKFQPKRSLGSNTIPHNVHVLNDYLIISHYTDGVEIVDASVPSNLVEVGYYDSWQGANGGFNGSWGAYPFLPSGLVLSSDIDNGLFVFDVDYKRAARITGTVKTGSLSGANLNGVTVSTSSSETINTLSDAGGIYKNGMVTPGNYTVTFSKTGYADLVINRDFVNGVEIILDTFMVLSSALPIELTSFTARASEQRNVQLDWVTAREVNNEYFSIERSTDGRTFTPIGRVSGADNSISPLAYYFTDDNPFLGENHYRIRQVDFDGTETVSDIRIVTFRSNQPENEVSVFPNPTADFIHFKQEISGDVIIYRADGSLLGIRKLEDRQRLDVSKLPAGSYWLRVNGEVVGFVKG